MKPKYHMFLSDLLENESNIVRLYRGDAEEIEVFDGNKNRRGIGLLFGHGIYLTDSKSVANEYTLSGAYKLNDAGKIVFRSPRDTREEAIRDYIGYIMDTKLNKDERFSTIKKVILDRVNNETNSLSKFSDEYQNLRNKAEQEFNDAWGKEKKKLVSQAKAMIKRDIASLKLVETGQGWQFIRDNHTGFLSEFHMPQSYVAATLHGDEPLPDDALKVISEMFYEAFEDRQADFRDRDDNYYQFDKWIETFREKGSRYAWRDTNIGGKGVNPSLDEVFNGTHGGFSFLYDDIRWDKFIARFQAIGYTGIQYYGGIRVGDNLRGGGATKHTAYVFWDANYINACRVTREPGSLTGHEIDLSVAPPRKLNRYTAYDA